MAIPVKETIDLGVTYYCQMNNLPIPITRRPKTTIPLAPPPPTPVVNKPSTKQLYPSEQCGITTCVMLLNYWYEFYGVPSITQEDIAGLIEFHDFDFINGTSTVRKLQKLTNYRSIINMELSFKNLDDILEAKVFPNTTRSSVFTTSDYEKILLPLEEEGFNSPIMVLSKLHPPNHFILIKGINFEKNCYIVHDPFNIPKEYKTKLNPQTFGQDALYPISQLHSDLFRSYCVYITLKNP